MKDDRPEAKESEVTHEGPQPLQRCSEEEERSRQEDTRNLGRSEAAVAVQDETRLKSLTSDSTGSTR